MAQAIVSVRMDEELKKEFDRICDELGMTMTTAVTMLAKKMTREKRLPFEASMDPFYSEENMAELKRRIHDIESGNAKVIRKTMAELEAMEDE